MRTKRRRFLRAAGLAAAAAVAKPALAQGMPELRWRFGYVFVWGLMIAVSAGLVWFFKKKQWM